VVKPDQQGSSLGVSIVHAPAALTAATDECFRYGAFGLMEQAIAGSEWTLGVLDDETLPVIKIETAGAFFDFSAKYQDDATQYLFEFAEPLAVVAAIIEAGRNACRALGTTGIARTDLRLDSQGLPFVLEVNTVPGLTDHSLVPKAAARVGIAFPELCRRMLDSALQHAPAVTTTHTRRAPRAWPTRQAG
jgi:D-alanine-D-alanine ligase